MEPNKPYEKLSVIRKAEDLCDLTYALSKTVQMKTDPGLCDQMRRAAVSIGSNITEGEWRWQTRDGIRFFQIAMGSAAELRFQAGVCGRNDLLPTSDAKRIVDMSDHVIAMLHKLIKARERHMEEKENRGNFGDR